MTATPIQIASAMAAIANGGILYRPHVVSKVVSATGQSVLESHPEGKRVMSPRTASLLRQMLRRDGKRARATSSTSQGIPSLARLARRRKSIRIRGAIHPSIGRRLSSDLPMMTRASFYVMVDEPREGHYGGEVAGPIFVKVASAVLPYLGVPPQIPPTVVTTTPPSRALLTEPYGPRCRSRSAIPASPMPSASQNFVGQGLGRAVELAAKAGLRLSVRGSGSSFRKNPRWQRSSRQRHSAPTCTAPTDSGPTDGLCYDANRLVSCVSSTNSENNCRAVS